MANYLGLKKATELCGARVRIKRDMQNHVAIMYKGTEANMSEYPPRNGKITLVFDQCNCCKVRIRMSHVYYHDLELTHIKGE